MNTCSNDTPPSLSLFSHFEDINTGLLRQCQFPVLVVDFCTLRSFQNGRFSFSRAVRRYWCLPITASACAFRKLPYFTPIG